MLDEKSLPRPSGAYQWGSCSASLGLQDQFPEPPELANESAEEGTACHWVAERVLLFLKQKFTEGDNSRAFPPKYDYVDKKADNDRLITEEMWDATEMYVNYILSFVDKLTVNNLHVEQKVELDHIYQGMSGTPDVWFYDAYTMTLHVFDLKFGRKLVSEYENPQLMIYASGILQDMPMFKQNEAIKVQLHIIQPRRYHEDGYCRSWEILATDMRNYINQLSYSAHLAMSDDTTCTVGTHCHYCSARHACNALHSTVQNCVDVETGYQPLVLHGDALASELTLLRHISEMIKFRLTSLEEQAMFEMSQGTMLNGWMVEPRLGRSKWRDDCDQQEILSMGKIMGVDLSVLKLDTPTQVKAKLKKMKIDTDVINDYAFRPQTGVKLLPDDGVKAKRAFGKN